MKTNFQKIKLNRKTSANSNSTRQVPAQDKTDKLIELRAKIEKEREIMRKSGKRFNKGGDTVNSNKKIQTVESLKNVQKTESSRFIKKGNRVAQMSIGPQESQKIQQNQPVTRQKVNLTQLVVEPHEISLNSSRLFEKELKQQKNKNQQVITFLKHLNLGEFAQGLINLGYDELDVLVQVTSEELNFLMMRAPQQKLLINAMKDYKTKNGLSQEKPVSSLFEKTQISFKAKAKNENVQQKKEEKIVSNITLLRPKSAITVASTIPTNNSGLFSNNSNIKPNPSFFIAIGGQQWSMDSLIRRACSVCYKILPGAQLIQKDEHYYCQSCEQKQSDPLGINMNSSFIRDYN